MAIRPNISLATNPNIGNTFQNALLNVQGAENLQRSREEAPLRNRLLQAQVGGAEAQTTQQEQLNNFQSVAFGATEILGDLKRGDLASVSNTLAQRRAGIVARGGDTTQTDNAIRLLQEDPQQLLTKVNEIIQVGQQQGILKAPIRGVPGTASERDFQTFQALQAKAQAPDATQEEITAANQFGRQAGFFRESAQELADIKVEQAKQTAEVEAGVKLETEPTIAASTAAAKAAITRSEKAFDQIGKIKTNVNNLDEIVRLIDEGAETGFIASKLPSVRSASVQLDNLQGRLGLDVIGETTFGALSESELAFALATALPKNLDGPDLRRWVLRKKDAQLKLSGYLEEVATFLGTPGNTTADFIELQKLNQLEQEQGAITEGAAIDAATLSDEDLFNF